MNKTEALKRLDALETEAAALRSIIEAPEKVEKKPLLGQQLSVSVYKHGLFRTSRQSEAYAEAINTMLDLRRQPGSEAAEDGERQFQIAKDGEVWCCSTLAWKLAQLCPCFDSQASALAARDAVGLDRILRMYNTLHGRGYE